MAYVKAQSEVIWFMLGHKTEGYGLYWEPTWKFVQLLDAGLLFPYKGNNTQSTPPAGFQLKVLGESCSTDLSCFFASLYYTNFKHKKFRVE